MANLFGFYSIPAWIKFDETSTYIIFGHALGMGICSFRGVYTIWDISAYIGWFSPLEAEGNMEDAIKVAKDWWILVNVEGKLSQSLV